MPWWWLLGYNGTRWLLILLYMMLAYSKIADSRGFFSLANPHYPLFKGYLYGYQKRNDFQQRHGKPEDADLFWRNNKAEDDARLMTIDLSALNQAPAIPVGRSSYRHLQNEVFSNISPIMALCQQNRATNCANYRSPMKLLGIDVSVLSRHPDPSLPTIRESFPILAKPMDNDIPSRPTPDDPFEESYFDNFLNEDDLTQGTIARGPYAPNTEPNEIYMFPLMDIPFKALTSYHGIVSSENNNKRDWKLSNLLNKSLSKDSSSYDKKHSGHHVSSFLENFILGKLHANSLTKRSKRSNIPNNRHKKGVKTCQEAAGLNTST